MARKKKEVVEEAVEGTVVQHLDRDPNDPRVNRSERGDSLPAYDEVVEETVVEDEVVEEDAE
jgi:hypothetical protein